MSERAPKNAIIDQIDRNQVTEEAPHDEARIMRATETLRSNLSKVMKYRFSANADNKVTHIKHASDVVERKEIPYSSSELIGDERNSAVRKEYRVIYDEFQRSNEDGSIIVTQHHADLIPIHGGTSGTVINHEMEVHNVDGSYVRYFVPGEDMYDEEPKMASYIAYDKDGMPELDDEGLAAQPEMSFDQIKELNELVFALQ